MAALLAQLQGARLRRCGAPREASLAERIGDASDQSKRVSVPRVSYAAARHRVGKETEPMPPHPRRTAKVMVLQRNCVNPVELDNILTKETRVTGRKPDFVILPEGAHREGGAASLEENALLRDLATVVNRHGVYAVLGTMHETINNGHHHCTALVVGPSGNLVATYRKRATQGVKQVPGHMTCTFDTPFGKVGIMICYDSENATFVDEALSCDPVLMLNPIHISAGCIRSHGQSTTMIQQRTKQWYYSITSISRHIDYIMSRPGHKCMAWVRCDQPYPVGAGTSQVTTKDGTQFVDSMGAINWSTILELGYPDKGSQPSHGLVLPPPLRERTDEKNNCGNRYTLRGTSVEWRGGVEEELVIVHEPSKGAGMKHPRGLIRLVDKISGKLLSTVDLFHMLPLTRSVQTFTQGVEPANNHVGDTGFRLVCSPRIDGQGSCALCLVRNVASGKSGASGNKSSDIGGVKDEKQGVPECHHVFLAPSTGISAVAYLTDPGVIVTLSAREAGCGGRCQLLQQIDGVSEKNRTSKTSDPSSLWKRRVLTVWEFSQNRRPVPLHELLV